MTMHKVFVFPLLFLIHKKLLLILVVIAVSIRISNAEVENTQQPCSQIYGYPDTQASHQLLEVLVGSVVDPGHLAVSAVVVSDADVAVCLLLHQSYRVCWGLLSFR